MHLKCLPSSVRLLGLVMILFYLWGVPAVQGAPPGPAANKVAEVEAASAKGDGNELPLYDELGRPMNQAAEAAKKNNNEKSKQKIMVVCTSIEEIEAFNATIEEERAGKKSPYLARAVLMDLDPQELVTRIKAGAGVNVEDPVFGTPLHVAISQARRTAIFQTLLENGADPNLVNKISRNKVTPLAHALSRNTPEILHVLLQAGADPNRMAFGEEPTLLFAIEQRKKELVQPLLDAGANPNVVNSDGTPALIRAVIRENDSVIQALLNAGAKANVTDHSGKTALNIALERSCSMETAAALLENGASGKQAKTTDGASLLHWAVEHDNARLLRAAIKTGAPLNSLDRFGRTPLQMARKMDRTEMINILVDAGAR